MKIGNTVHLQHWKHGYLFLASVRLGFGLTHVFARVPTVKPLELLFQDCVVKSNLYSKGQHTSMMQVDPILNLHIT
jgi:hypothetical protein